MQSSAAALSDAASLQIPGFSLMPALALGFAGLSILGSLEDSIASSGKAVSEVVAPAQPVSDSESESD